MIPETVKKKGREGRRVEWLENERQTEKREKIEMGGKVSELDEKKKGIN